jgi:hypothetical protein
LQWGKIVIFRVLLTRERMEKELYGKKYRPKNS